MTTMYAVRVFCKYFSDLAIDLDKHDTSPRFFLSKDFVEMSGVDDKSSANAVDMLDMNFGTNVPMVELDVWSSP